VLFLPSYWWHEGTSTPDPKSGLQIGLNHWFHPYFTQAQTIDHFQRNSLYRHLWEDQEQPNVKVPEASKGSIEASFGEQVVLVSEGNTQDKLVSESRWWAPQAKREDVTAAAIAPGAKASGSVDGFSYKAEGYISKGGDILVRKMTLVEAQALCTTTPSCMALTFRSSSSNCNEARCNIRLKNHSKYGKSPGWQSYTISRVDVPTEKPSDSPRQDDAKSWLEEL